MWYHKDHKTSKVMVTKGNALKGKCLRLSWLTGIISSMVDCIKYHSYGDANGWLHKKCIGGTRWWDGTYDKLEVDGKAEGGGIFWFMLSWSCSRYITFGQFNIFQKEIILHGHAFNLYHIHVITKLGILWILSWKYCKQVH